jgi:cyanophycin synthetase
MRKSYGLLQTSTGSARWRSWRGIPWIRLNKYSLCQLGYGANQSVFRSQ